MKALETFPQRIQDGIILHRKIDGFMDSHPLVLQGKVRLRPNHGKFSPIIMDLFYDHFLARKWIHHSDEQLDKFIQNKYNLIEHHWEILPQRIKHLFPYMKESNWLASYQHVNDLQQILANMDKRMLYNSQMKQSVIELNQYYSLFEEEFDEFMLEIKQFVKENS